MLSRSENPPLRSILVGVLAASLCAAPIAPAFAAPADGGDDAAPAENTEADAFASAAVEAFEAGRYDEAVENFRKAFELDKNPNNLFNIGRVYEESGDLDKAVEFYKQFLGQPGVSIENRQVAVDRVEVLERALEAMKPEEPDPEPDPEPEEPDPEVTPEPEPPVDTTDGGEDKRRTQRGVGFALLGVGAAMAVGGGVVGGLSVGANSDYENAATLADREAAADRGNTLTTTADVLYGVGGTLAIVGLIVALTALPKKNKAGKTALVPVFRHDGGGFALTHRF